MRSKADELFVLANSSLRSGNYQGADAMFSEVLGDLLEPLAKDRRVALFVGRASARVRLGRPLEALADTKAALGLAPTHAQAGLVRAEAEAAKAARAAIAGEADNASKAAAAAAEATARVAELEQQLLWQGKETQAKVVQLRQAVTELEKTRGAAAAEEAKRVALEEDFREQTRAQETLAGVLEQTRAELQITQQALDETSQALEKTKSRGLLGGLFG